MDKILPMGDLLNVVNPHSQVEYPDTPALVATGRCMKSIAVKRHAARRRLVSILIDSQSPSCLVLYNDVTFAIARPIGQMYTVSRSRNPEVKRDSMTPCRRRVDVDVDLIDPTVLIDPNEVVAPRVAHIAVIAAVGLEFRAALSLVLPDKNIISILLFLEENIVEAVGAVDAPKFYAVLDASGALTGVRKTCRSPIGHLLTVVNKLILSILTIVCILDSLCPCRFLYC